MKAIPVLCALSLLLLACDGGEKSPAAKGESDSSNVHAGTDSTGTSAAGSAAGGDTAASSADARRFGYKSGIVAMVNRSTKGTSATFYFDDYGARQATVNDIQDSVDGKPITIRNINVVSEGWSILYDPTKKVGMKNKVVDGSPNMIPRFDVLSDSQRVAMGYKKLGTQQIAGKECQGHSYVGNGIPMTVWTWEGIPLRSEVGFGTGQTQVLEATSVKVDVPVPPEILTVPSDVKLKENTLM